MRQYLNPCTFSYSAWNWDWSRWEQVMGQLLGECALTYVNYRATICIVFLFLFLIVCLFAAVPIAMCVTHCCCRFPPHPLSACEGQQSAGYLPSSPKQVSSRSIELRCYVLTVNPMWGSGDRLDGTTRNQHATSLHRG